MPRRGRLDLEGFTYHVYTRGVDKRPIFLDEEDHASFLSRLKRVSRPPFASILAWSLNGNHFHAIWRRGEVAMGIAFRAMLTGYSGWFNRKYQRSGTLFENRFKDRIILNEGYLHRALLYVNLNPLKHGLVSSRNAMDEYPWSSHRAFLRGIPDGILDWPVACTAFGSDPARIAEDYLSLSSCPEPTREDLEECFKAPDFPISGDDITPIPESEFVSVLVSLENRIERKAELPPGSIRRRDKRQLLAHARREFCREAIAIPGSSVGRIARFLGRTSSAVSKLIAKWER